jgi:putative PIN family toxin of toxin-antitoxin system
VRILFDTNILVSAFLRPNGLIGRTVATALEPAHLLVSSREILTEVTRTLRYERLALYHRKNEDEIYKYLTWLYENSELITIDPTRNMPIRDVKDNIILQTAIRGSIHVLCTQDQDFFNPPASQFLFECGIEVMNAQQLFAILCSRN